MDPPPDSHLFGSDLKDFVEKQKKFGGSIFSDRGSSDQLGRSVDGIQGSQTIKDVDSINRGSIPFTDCSNLMAGMNSLSDKATCQKSQSVVGLQSEANRSMGMYEQGKMDRLKEDSMVINPDLKFFSSGVQDRSDRSNCQMSKLKEGKPASNRSSSVRERARRDHLKENSMENSLSLSLSSSISSSTKRTSGSRRSEKIVVKKSKAAGGSINKLGNDGDPLGLIDEACFKIGMNSQSPTSNLQNLNSGASVFASATVPMELNDNVTGKINNVAVPIANQGGFMDPNQANIPFTDLSSPTVMNVAPGSHSDVLGKSTDVNARVVENENIGQANTTQVGGSEGDVHMAENGEGNEGKKSPVKQQVNAWKTNGVTLADKIRGNSDSKIVLKYKAPVVLSDGRVAVRLSKEVVMEGSKKNSMLLIGHFVGVKLPFFIVNNNMNRMWRKYGLVNVAPNYEGYYLFKFNNEEGMKFVIENGPWLVNGIPLFVSKWEPGMYLGKPELKTLPLWVNLYGVPLEVWNAEGLGELASAIGKPLALDRATEERCVAQAGRAGFARILVEVSAVKPIADEIIALVPNLTGGSEKEISVRATYNWKPMRCKHCNVFGHIFDNCSVRPLTEEEVAAKMKVEEVKGSKADADDGFQEVGRRNRPIQNQGKRGGFQQVNKGFKNTRDWINQRFGNQKQGDQVGLKPVQTNNGVSVNGVGNRENVKVNGQQNGQNVQKADGVESSKQGQISNEQENVQKSSFNGGFKFGQQVSTKGNDSMGVKAVVWQQKSIKKKNNGAVKIQGSSSISKNVPEKVILKKDDNKQKDAGGTVAMDSSIISDNPFAVLQEDTSNTVVDGGGKEGSNVAFNKWSFEKLEVISYL